MLMLWLVEMELILTELTLAVRLPVGFVCDILIAKELGTMQLSDKCDAVHQVRGFLFEMC